MQHTLTFLLLFLLSNHISGQSPSFFADGSRWVYHTYETSEPGQYFDHSSVEQNIIHGDTLINDFRYFKLYSTFHNIKTVNLTYMPPLMIHSYDSVGPVFFRYDTILKKVYYLPDVNLKERLIYDFNLQVGDTTPMQSTTFYTTIVRSIDTVSLFGISLKRFFLTDVIDSMIFDRNFILEGIGGSNGLTYFQPEYGSLSGGTYMTGIGCFQYMDSTYAPYDGTCPFINFVTGNIPVVDEYKLTISPNPTQDLFTITISDELLNSTFSIIDALGRLTHSFKLTEVNSTAQLNESGIYFWRIEHGGRLIRTGKLVCE